MYALNPNRTPNYPDRFYSVEEVSVRMDFLTEEPMTPVRWYPGRKLVRASIILEALIKVRKMKEEGKALIMAIQDVLTENLDLNMDSEDDEDDDDIYSQKSRDFHNEFYALNAPQPPVPTTGISQLTDSDMEFLGYEEEEKPKVSSLADLVYL